MGIPYFESVVESKQDEGLCQLVYLEELAKECKAQTGKTPVLVVDGTNFVHHFYLRPDIPGDYVRGGQFKDFIEFSKFFVARLRGLNIEPVFYFDGPTVNTRIKYRQERNLYKMAKYNKIFEHIGKSRPDISRILPVLLSVAGRFIFKYECECKVLVSIRDCDEELAAYTNRESCFAILSQDTDFLCMKNAAYYLSIKHLSVQHMQTLLYDRCAVLNYYGFTTQQMWLFASLMGNDVISVDRLSNFHKQLRQGDKSKEAVFTEISKYVKNMTKECCNDVEKSVKDVISDLSNFNLDIEESELRASLKSYQPSELDSWIVDKNTKRSWLEVLEVAYSRHTTCEAVPDVYSTLVDNPYEIGMFLEQPDAQDQESSRIFLPLRQQIYSLLLHEKPWGNSPHEVKEFGHWNGVWHDLERVKVPDLKDGNHHPGLVVLWTKDTPRVSLQRWTLFANAISPQLDPAVFQKISYHYVVPVAVLLYLMEINFYLHENEIESFIKQAVIISSLKPPDLDPSKLLKNITLTKKMINLSTLFGYGISMVLFLMSVLGFPLHKAMPWYYFDGPLFHYFLDKGTNDSPFSTNLPQYIHHKNMQNRLKEDVEIIKQIVGFRSCYGYESTTIPLVE